MPAHYNMGRMSAESSKVTIRRLGCAGVPWVHHQPLSWYCDGTILNDWYASTTASDKGIGNIQLHMQKINWYSSK